MAWIGKRNGRVNEPFMPVFASDSGQRFVISCGSFTANGRENAIEMGERCNDICLYHLVWTGEVISPLVTAIPGKIGECPILILSDDD